MTSTRWKCELLQSRSTAPNRDVYQKTAHSYQNGSGDTNPSTIVNQHVNQNWDSQTQQVQSKTERPGNVNHGDQQKENCMRPWLFLEYLVEIQGGEFPHIKPIFGATSADVAILRANGWLKVAFWQFWDLCLRKNPLAGNSGVVFHLPAKKQNPHGRLAAWWCAQMSICWVCVMAQDAKRRFSLGSAPTNSPKKKAGDERIFAKGTFRQILAVPMHWISGWVAKCLFRWKTLIVCQLRLLV